MDGSRDGAVDGRGRRLVLERARVRGHPPRRDRAAPQCPEKFLVPVLARLLLLYIRERARDALVGVVHRLVDGRTVFRREAILLVPDIERCLLESDGIEILGFDLHDSVHVIRGAPIFLTPRLHGLQGKNRPQRRWSPLLAPRLTGRLLPLRQIRSPETSPRLRDPWSLARTQDLVSGS